MRQIHRTHVIYTINLHGNSKKKETCPDGSPDENVFDIMQGVSINLFVKTGQKKDSELGKVYYYDLYGKREDKYNFLAETPFSKVDYQELKPTEPMYFFVPKDFSLEEEYNKGVKVSEMLEINSMGITTGHDKDLVSFTPFKGEYNYPYYYRPFDTQWINYDLAKVTRAREKVMSQFKRDNIGLCLIKVNSATDGVFKVLVTKGLTDKTLLSSKDNVNVFPLYLYPDSSEKIPNLNPEEWKKFDVAVGRATSPEEILAYVYAVLHSPSYRERYKEFLKVDFPRIPLPENAESFERLVKIGQQLIDLHLMKNCNQWRLETTFPMAGNQRVEKYKYADGCVWINETQYFGNVPESAWQFFIGGYQPAQKWLKDRVGRTLSFDEIRHYMQMVYALTMTQTMTQTLT